MYCALLGAGVAAPIEYGIEGKECFRHYWFLWTIWDVFQFSYHKKPYSPPQIIAPIVLATILRWIRGSVIQHRTVLANCNRLTISALFYHIHTLYNQYIIKKIILKYSCFKTLIMNMLPILRVYLLISLDGADWGHTGNLLFRFAPCLGRNQILFYVGHYILETILNIQSFKK